MSITKRMKGGSLMISTILGAVAAFSGEVACLSLWQHDAPESKGDGPADKPDITVHLPTHGKAPVAAVLVCPGGGYGVLCSTYEGHDIAKWLNAHGVAGVVLKYRVSPYRHPVPLRDVQRAMRLVRQNASEWGIDPGRIGVMGFSAGGHLASTLGTHFDAGAPESVDPVDRQSCRPDFMMLVYPVVTMGIKTHRGSMANLLDPNPTQTEKDCVSNELHVSADTPMAFIAHSVKDSVVPVENSRLLYEAMKAKGIPVEYFELPKGDHGLGCGKSEEWAAWQSECLKWLEAKRLTGKAQDSRLTR